MNAGDLGRLLVALGLGLAALGGLVLLLGRVVDLGNLPGDLVYRGDNVRIYVPIATMIVVSIVLTVVLNLLLRLFR
jgi:TctA family transporter